MRKRNARGSFVMHGLESRTFLSAGTVAHAPPPRGGPGAGLEAGLVAGPCNEIGPFLPASPNDTVKADLTKLQTDKQMLATDLKALTSAQKATLQTDEAAIRTAIDALKTTLSPLQTTLKTDLLTWTKTILTDQQAIRTDLKNGTDATADQAKLK